jgi:hypothetical protein
MYLHLIKDKAILLMSLCKSPPLPRFNESLSYRPAHIKLTLIAWIDKAYRQQRNNRAAVSHVFKLLNMPPIFSKD